MPAVVGIGASAGGLEALEEFFANVPADTGMAFVVITHQHPEHVSLLPEILQRNCRIPVSEAADGARVEPNRVYVPPAGVKTAILNGRLQITKTTDAAARHLPIDFFFRSLAADQKERAVCVILSGTGSDGSLGLRAIKAEAGMAMVQDATSAKYAGMPSSAIATGLADYVLPPRTMPAQLAAYAVGAYLRAGPVAPAPSGLSLEWLEKILVLLRAHTRHDFSAYKQATIRRRIERRMNVQQITGAEQYVRYLKENPAELDLLFAELLISVTSFFRDRPAWETLIDEILPKLLANLPENYALRIWVPSCATGEEAYSVAIALRECMERLHRHCDVQIFASDLDPRAIEFARAGKYPEGIAADVPTAWLTRYFTVRDQQYIVNKEIRNLVVFAPHNALSDPPFTRLDWVSCRNLLIYLDVELQKRLLRLFHYALKPGGLLFLGTSESIGDHDDLFDVVDRRWRIFSRRQAQRNTSFAAFPVAVSAVEHLPLPASSAPIGREQPISHLVEQVLLSRYSPPGVVVNQRGDVVYIHGRTGRYLEPADGGQPRLNLIDMARQGLGDELRVALHQAGASQREIIRPDVRLKSDGRRDRVTISVVRLDKPEPLRGLFLVTFQPTPVPLRQKGSARLAGPRRTEQLVRALREAKESLHATVAQLATSNEELKSANEELQSINEEMQSSNEELETSREELQSLNEELATVNAEQATQVDELARARDDMQNLLNSTDIATLYLDNDLRIRRYTDASTKLIHLIPTDLNRPIFDQASNLKSPRLTEDCREVLRTLKPLQAEVETNDGTWQLMRILPYRTIDNAIEGLVITFVNITDVTLAEKAAFRATERQGDGELGFPHARPASENDIAAFVEEPAGAGFLKERAIEGRLEGEVKIAEPLHPRQPGEV